MKFQKETIRTTDRYGENMKFMAAFLVALALTITWQTYSLARQQAASASPSETGISPSNPDSAVATAAWNRPGR
jgi:hypothetical protein